MCGRYILREVTEQDVLRLASFSDEELHLNRYGDIHPSETGLVLTGSGGKFAARAMRWGFPAARKGQLLINARAETVFARPSFAASAEKRRCVVPAAGFYEWDAKKVKVTYFLPDRRTIYMAGIYNMFGEEERFVILTTAANVSVADVHDRMPVILNEAEAADWVFDESRAAALLRKTGPALMAERPREEYRQLTLF